MILSYTGHHATSVVTLFFSLTHVTCVALNQTAVIRNSTSVTYWTLCHNREQLVIYCECYGFKRAFFTLRRFFYLALFPDFSRPPWDRQFNLKVKTASRWSVWITAIHKRFICGRFYLRASAGQSGNINLHGELVLQNIRFEMNASYGIWTLFAICEEVTSLLS